MKGEKLLAFIGSICLIIVLTVSMAACAKAPGPTRVVIAGSKLGAVGSAEAASQVSACRKYIPDIIFSYTPTGGSTSSMRLYADGQLDIAFCSDFQLYQALHKEGPFAEEPLKKPLYQGLYFSSVQYPISVPVDSDIHSYADLDGKKVFLYPMAMGAHDMYVGILDALGYSVEHVEVGFSDVPDTLKTGRIDGAVTHCIGMKTPNAYTQELYTRLAMRPLALTPEEAEIVGTVAAVAVVDFVLPSYYEPERAGVDHVLCPSIGFGFHPGPELSEEIVYKWYKTCIEHMDELEEISVYWGEPAEQGLDFQPIWINAVPDVPIHPGVAKCLKEKGVWNEAWKIGELK